MKILHKIFVEEKGWVIHGGDGVVEFESDERNADLWYESEIEFILKRVREQHPYTPHVIATLTEAP